MNTLSRTLRKQLERTVVDARDVAKSGSQAAVEALTVHERDYRDRVESRQQ